MLAGRLVICDMTELLQDVLTGDLFMQCDTPNQSAFRPLPNGFTVRLCKREELIIWKTIFAQGKYMDFVSQYYDKVYAPYENDFFRRCVFVVDENDMPIATSGTWLSYRQVNTLLGFFVLPTYQGQGIGRGLLSIVLENTDCPIYLHTHPSATRAIKLYSDFGFKFVTDPVVGYRRNILQESLPYFKEVLTEKDYAKLLTEKANPALLEAALLSEYAEF